MQLLEETKEKLKNVPTKYKYKILCTLLSIIF